MYKAKVAVCSEMHHTEFFIIKDGST